MEEARTSRCSASGPQAIDIGKQAVTVTSGTERDQRGGRAQETGSSAQRGGSCPELAEWLRSWGVERDGRKHQPLRKPVFFLLEPEGVDCGAVPGVQGQGTARRPKTDKLAGPAGEGAARRRYSDSKRMIHLLPRVR